MEKYLKKNNRYKCIKIYVVIHLYMKVLQLAVLASGKGSNLLAIIKAIENGILPCKISVVCTNKKCGAHDIAVKYQIPTIQSISPEFKNKSEREKYDEDLAGLLKEANPDIVVLAGWMHILSSKFIDNFRHIINLHPALSNTFKGANAIEDAFTAYHSGKIKYSGVMVHRVIPRIDSGPVISEMIVPMSPTDTLEVFTENIKAHEKACLVSAIATLVGEHNKFIVNSRKSFVYEGKVRTVRDIGYNCLLLEASDRLSAFNSHRCIVPNKGRCLNMMSEWWLKNTSHIIPNHYLWSCGKYMVVKKTTPIKLEVIVRGYLTGSSSTSVWKMYAAGQRNIYGYDFEDGMKQHQKLESPIITPTTKDDDDQPITEKEIIEQGLLSKKDWELVSKAAMELYKYGVEESKKKGLCLVDTKYEFGRDVNGNIILIDEVHTCDSSRYWYIQDEPYTEVSPKKIDKDMVRDWLQQNCADVYKDSPAIPKDVVKNVTDAYVEYTKLLFSDEPSRQNSITLSQTSDTWTWETAKNIYLNYYKNGIVCIVAGSTKDEAHVNKIAKCLADVNIYSSILYCSAHKNTKKVINYIEKHDSYDRKMVWVTVAGRSNALSGVVAANSRHPVIGCPPFADKDDMMVNINSTLQCPSNVPVMTILEPGNVALAISKIFS